MEPKEETGSVEEDGVDNGDDDVGDAVAIEVLGAPIVASDVEVADHDRRYGRII